jgi:hypothetical protein
MADFALVRGCVSSSGIVVPMIEGLPTTGGTGTPARAVVVMVNGALCD